MAIRKTLNWHDNLETLRRFPASAMCSVLLFGVLIHINHSYEAPAWSVEQAAGVLILAFFGLGAVQLAREGRGWGVPRTLLGSGLVLFACAWFGFAPDWQAEPVFLLLLGSMLAFLLAAPVGGRDNMALWHSGAAMLVTAITAFLIAFVLFLGLILAMQALNLLFDLRIEGAMFADIWALCAALFAPLLALGNVPFPGRAEERIEGLKGRAARIAVEWILVPLCYLYLAILYAYFARLLVTFELPNGYLAALTLGFAGVGLFTWLLGYGLTGAARGHTRFFHRWFFIFLSPAIVMMLVAVGVRIGEYGLTESRLVLLAAGLWLAAVCCVYGLNRAAPLVWMPVSLGILFFLLAAQPFNVARLSVLSQEGRLERLIEAAGGLNTSGHFLRGEEDIPRGTRMEIMGAVDYLEHRNQHAFLNRIFRRASAEEWEGGAALLESAGLTYFSEWERRDTDMRQNTYVFQTLAGALPVTGYDYIFSFDVYRDISQSFNVGPARWDILTGGFEVGVMGVVPPGGDALHYDLRPLQARMKTVPRRADDVKDAYADAPILMTQVMENGTRVTLAVVELRSSLETERHGYTSGRFSLLIDLPD